MRAFLDRRGILFMALSCHNQEEEASRLYFNFNPIKAIAQRVELVFFEINVIRESSVACRKCLMAVKKFPTLTGARPAGFD